MGIKKQIKKGKKAVDKGVDSAGKAVSDTTDWAGKQVNKGYNAATGAIDDVLDEVCDYGKDQINAGIEYAEKTYNDGVDWLEDLADAAIDAAYREAYDSVIGDYIELAAAFLKAETTLLANDDNILPRIRDNLFAGKFSDASADVEELLTLDVMKRPLELGHELHGTSFIIAADLSVSGSYGYATAGVAGSIGITRMLDHFESYEHSTCVFTAVGASAGLGVSGKGSSPVAAELGIIMGFVSKDPTNISGWFVDLSGGGGLENGIFSAGLSWSPPGTKAPYVKPKPVAGNIRVAASTETVPSASVTLGGSYTWLLQKIKNPFYKG